VGLYYGNYISEEQVRYAGGNREILIDVNLHRACDNLQLTYTRWDNANEKNPQGENFLFWTQRFLQQKVPVIGGFYLQERDGDKGLNLPIPLPLSLSLSSQPFSSLTLSPLCPLLSALSSLPSRSLT
jgi:hypothetical protein